MKRILVLLLIVGGILAVTNPDMGAFRKYARLRAADHIERELGKGVLADLLGGAGSELLGDNIDRFTTRRSYLVASTYTVDLDRDGHPNGRVLGVAGQFIVVEEFRVED